MFYLDGNAIKYAYKRFCKKHTPVPESGCWLWEGLTNNRGYGVMSCNGRITYAHRFSFEYYKGPIPTGLELDHLCRVPCCVNPNHLEAVTHRENVLRGTGQVAAKFKQTHCVNGHELIGYNVRVRNDRPGTRDCRACHNINERDRFRRRRAEGKL